MTYCEVNLIVYKILKPNGPEWDTTDGYTVRETGKMKLFESLR